MQESGLTHTEIYRALRINRTGKFDKPNFITEKMELNELLKTFNQKLNHFVGDKKDKFEFNNQTLELIHDLKNNINRVESKIERIR